MKDEDLFPAGLKGIIFDCDGVMIDSVEANRQFYNLILSHLDLPPMTISQETFAFQATAEQALRSMIPESWHDRIPQLVRESLDYDKDVLPRIKLMPGFEIFMHKAHNEGIRLGIDTNRTDYGIQRVLDFFDLPQYFNPVITSSDCEPKPSSQGAEKIYKAWDVAPEQVLFIGDSPDDRLAALGAGCKFAAFGKSPLQGDIKVESFKSLAHRLWPEIST